ncbi:MAG: insulinase family protein [Spirochaetota bacterium]
MSIHGFDSVDEHDLPEYRARGRWFRHEQTGAEVYHVANDDPENLFAFAFKTLPSDSTGVAHILEHTVLCGSRHYPVKDPFILLVKGSLNTFLNAMTYPDKTVYPASSTVERDLFNIMQVYGDAVFFPRLEQAFFRQEGHRLQFDANGELEITGIVYNEMKGTYANHDSIAGRWAYRALLPDTPYGYDSGGDPKVIPDLSYEDFLGFHRTYYHPSNARIFVYGDIPTERYLDVLDRTFLSHFERLDADFDVPLQPRWAAPRDRVVTCPTDGEEGPTSVTVSWLVDPVTDPKRLIAHELLAYIVLGTSAGPLRKRLVESGLGDDLSAPSGLETDLREMVFGAGLRGTSPEKKADVEQLVLDTLADVARDGLDADVVEAAFRTVEFRNREIRGGAPNGLRLMGKALRGWLHGVSPDVTVRFTRPFEALREEAAPGSRFFERLVESSLLENPHRVTVTVRPDPQQNERERAELAARLSTVDAGLTDDDRERLRAEQAALEELQQTPDDPDAVARIPFLKTGDLPRELEVIPTAESALSGGVPLYTHDVFANGVVYLDLAFDLSGLDPELLPWVPLYIDSVGELGLPGRSYDEVATEIALRTGGMSAFCEAAIPLHEVRRADRRVYVRMKALESTFGEAVDLLRSILLESQFANTDRVDDLIKEGRSGMSGSVLPSGHRFAALRAGRALSEAGRHEERWRGATQLLFMHGLSEARVSEASAALERVNDALIRRGNLTVNLTGTEAAQSRVRPHLERLVAGLPEGGWASEADPIPEEQMPTAEALIVPADVSYVAAAVRGGRIGSDEYVHEQVLAHLLRTGYLWEAIRMRGGAYGASATARGMDAVFGFWSYRDPQITATIDAFGASLEHFACAPVSDDELDLAIIGVTGQHVRPLSPGEKSIVGLRRTLYGVTDELRQRNHEVLLKTSARDVQNAADRLGESMAQSYVAVVSGADAVARAAERVPGLAENQIRLPV